MMQSNRSTSGVWQRIADLTIRRARRVLVLAGIVSVLAFLSASTLRPVASIESMLADHQPGAVALKRIATEFRGMDELLLLVSVPMSSGESDATTVLLAFAERFEAEIRSTPALSQLCADIQYRPPSDLRAFTESVIIPNAVYYLSEASLRGLHDRLSLEQMRDQLRRSEEALTLPGAGGGAIGRTVLRDPLGLRDFLVNALPRPGGADTNMMTMEAGFFGRDGKTLLIRLRGSAPSSDLKFADAFTDAMTRAGDRVNHDALDLDLAGAYAIAAAAQHSIRSDMIKSIVLSILFLHILYFVVYGSIWTLPGALLPVALGITTALGLFAALGMSLTPITAVIGAILAGLGIDYAIHSLSHYQSHRTAGLDDGDAIRHTLPEVGPAMLAACATTVTGFVAISQSDVRALREFGLLGAMGLVASLLTTVFVLPSLLTMTSGRRQPTARHERRIRFATLLDHIVGHRKAYLTMSLVGAVSAVVLAVVSSERVSIYESDLTVMHPRPNRPLETQHRLSELFQTSPDALLIHLQADTPENLTILGHRVRSRLSDVESNGIPNLSSFGLGDLLPDPSKTIARSRMLGSFDATRILNDFETALQDSAFNPDAFESYKSFIRRLVAPGEPPRLGDLTRYAGLSEMVMPTSGLETESLTALTTSEPLRDRRTRDQVIETVRSALDGITGATLTGISVIGYDTERVIRGDLQKLLSIAGGVVLVGLIGYFRSVWGALLALAPGAFGIAILLGCMYLMNLRLNTMNLIALPLLIGIGVDDGIFLVTIARSANDQGRDRSALVTRLGAGCHAICMTSLSTMLTFGTLAFTSTPAIRSLGVLMFIGVLGSLIGAVALLVPLLTRSRVPAG